MATKPMILQIALPKSSTPATVDVSYDLQVDSDSTDVTIDWDDGEDPVPLISGWSIPLHTYEYQSDEDITKSIKIRIGSGKGLIGFGVRFTDIDDYISGEELLVSVDSWGDHQLKTLTNAFRNCTSLIRVAAPPRTVVNMNGMFYGASSFKQDISNWNVTNIMTKPPEFDTGTLKEWTTAMKPVWGRTVARLIWDSPKDRTYYSGVDRGVIYPPGKPPVVWNGLVSVSDGGNQSVSAYYIDGQKYLTVVSPSDYSARVSAYTFPKEFEDLCGISRIADGLYIDSQVPDKFDMSYRTTYSDSVNEGYRIHFVYGVTAMMSEHSYQTLTDSVDPTTFEFELDAVPPPAEGMRATAHAMVDSNDVDQLMLKRIEDILYGTENFLGSMPSIQQLFELMNYGGKVLIYGHEPLLTRESKGEKAYSTFTLEGEDSILQINVDPRTGKPDGTFTVLDPGLADEQVEFDLTGEHVGQPYDNYIYNLEETQD